MPLEKETSFPLPLKCPWSPPPKKKKILYARRMQGLLNDSFNCGPSCGCVASNITVRIRTDLCGNPNWVADISRLSTDEKTSASLVNSRQKCLTRPRHRSCRTNDRSWNGRNHQKHVRGQANHSINCCERWNSLAVYLWPGRRASWASFSDIVRGLLDRRHLSTLDEMRQLYAFERSA